jgi:ketosteroid isomerase-like protein
VPETTPVRSARQTVELLLHTTVSGDRDQMADLYAADAVIEIPFAPDGMPSVTEGRETLRARMKASASLLTFESVSDVTLHETTDPEVIVAEYRIHGHLSSSGKPFSLAFVMIVRVRDGLIVWSRDYSNPLETAALLRD